MLRIVQNQAPASAKTYYSAGAYYSEGQELAGQWGGKTAARLGLEGEIEQRDFEALCDNRAPRTGERLTARTRTGRTVGYDVNVHVPKGVSLAYTLGGDDRVLTAFQDSLRETMADFERDAETRVRVGGRDQNRRTGNLVWGEFVHKTARPVNGLPDPHLHAHCFVFNVTFDDMENRYKAAQFRHLKQDAPYYEALVHARLARRLAALGYTIERTGRSWDIAEIPKALRDKFSRRRDQIEELARAKGITDAAEKDGLGARTRERKLAEFTMPELLDRWRGRLQDDELRVLQPPDAGQEIHGAAAEHAAGDAVAAAIAHCFGQSAVLPERAVLADALRRGVGRVSPRDIDVAARRGLIVRTINGQRLATTETALRDEREIIETVRAGRCAADPLHEGWTIQRDWLSERQQLAVRQLLNSRDRVQLLLGGAAAGKAELMHEVAEAINRFGGQLWTVTPVAASRSSVCGQGMEPATTIAELLAREPVQRQAYGQTWWVPLTGPLSTRQLRDLLRMLERLHARLIISDDWRQYGSVDRGGMLQQVASEAGIRAARLSGFQRQSSENPRIAGNTAVSAVTPLQRERQATAERHHARERVAAAGSQEPPRIDAVLEAANGA